MTQLYTLSWKHVDIRPIISTLEDLTFLEPYAVYQQNIPIPHSEVRTRQPWYLHTGSSPVMYGAILEANTGVWNSRRQTVRGAQWRGVETYHAEELEDAEATVLEADLPLTLLRYFEGDRSGITSALVSERLSWKHVEKIKPTRVQINGTKHRILQWIHDHTPATAADIKKIYDASFQQFMQLQDKHVVRVAPGRYELTEEGELLLQELNELRDGMGKNSIAHLILGLLAEDDAIITHYTSFISVADNLDSYDGVVGRWKPIYQHLVSEGYIQVTGFTGNLQCRLSEKGLQKLQELDGDAN